MNRKVRVIGAPGYGDFDAEQLDVQGVEELGKAVVKDAEGELHIVPAVCAVWKCLNCGEPVARKDAEFCSSECWDAHYDEGGPEHLSDH